MSKPISRACVALEDEVVALTGKRWPVHKVQNMAVRTIRIFLTDARDEGRFDNAVIDQLLADI